MEGMESGERDENSTDKDVKTENGPERKRTASGNSISDSTSTPTNVESKPLSLDLPHNNLDKSVIKSPNVRSPIISPEIRSPSYHSKLNNDFDREHMSIHGGGKHGLLSPGKFSGLVSPLGFQHDSLTSPKSQTFNFTSKWFSLFPKKACDETSLTRSSIISPSVSKGKDIVPPTVRLLSQDRHFIDSVSMRPGLGTHFSGHPVNQDRPGYPSNAMNSNSHPRFQFSGQASPCEQHPHGFPDGVARGAGHDLPSSGVDIQRLIEQDPQKAAVLLDIQSLEPAVVPEG